MEKLSAETSALNWFEIPVTDVDRAKKFYETIFEITMQPVEMMGMHMAMFPSQIPHLGGALVQSPSHQPSTSGSIVYLNGNPDLQGVLDRAVEAGGTVTMPKMEISPENGHMAIFLYTEGNAVGLHSMQ